MNVRPNVWYVGALLEGQLAPLPDDSVQAAANHNKIAMRFMTAARKSKRGANF